jgi:hypothetical protein
LWKRRGKCRGRERGNRDDEKTGKEIRESEKEERKRTLPKG